MDLSKVLGDVYDSGDRAAPTPAGGPPAAPEWSDDAHLDKAFADWTPGPPPEASANERNIMAGATSQAPRLDDDLAAALSAALVDVAPRPQPHEIVLPDVPVPNDPMPAVATALTVPDAPLVVPVEAPSVASSPSAALASELWAGIDEPAAALLAPPTRWQRSDDDVLPGKGGRSKAPRAARAPRPSMALPRRHSDAPAPVGALVGGPDTSPSTSADGADNAPKKGLSLRGLRRTKG